MKIGDMVRMTRLPEWVDRLPFESQEVFAYCVGRVYPVTEITPEGFLVLDVSGDVDELFGGFMNDLRVEPEFIELAQNDGESH